MLTSCLHYHHHHHTVLSYLIIFFLFFSRAETASLVHIHFLFILFFAKRPHRSCPLLLLFCDETAPLKHLFSSYFYFFCSCRDRIARAHIFFLFSYRDHATPFPQDAMFFLQSEYSLFVCLPFFYLITSPIDFSIFSIVKFVLIHRSQILNEKKLII